MEWMLESTLENNSHLYDLVFVNYSPDEIRFFVAKEAVSYETVSSTAQLERHHLKSKVFVMSLNEKSFEADLKCLVQLSIENHSSRVIVNYGDLSSEKIIEFLNNIDVYAVIQKDEELPTRVQQALFESQKSSMDLSKLSKTKEQNLRLEELSKNLEKLVHERTKKEFIENQKTVESLKDMQSLLSFIKAVSRCESIEDLLNHVREEFRKIHGLMPPILLLGQESLNTRLLYFQGKQLTEKKVRESSGEVPLARQSLDQLRATLSNILGRPFGNVSQIQLDFQSPEVHTIHGNWLFEHSLSQSNLEFFQLFSSERLSVINMALESILLSERQQDIARLWAKTFNNMSDPILIVDSSYQMTLSNSDYHKKENLTCYQSFAGLTKPCNGCPVRETFATEQPQIDSIHCNGQFYRVHSYPIRVHEEEKVSHVINHYVNVTQSVDLQSRVIQGEKMAAVGLLAGNIAHELNNPLTGIFSLAQLLLEDFEKTSNTYKDLNEIKAAAARCQSIIKNLLDFSAIGADSKQRKVELNDLVTRTLPLLKMSMRELNADIQLGEQKLYVLCNSQLLQQVVFNLVNNACQAMEPGGHLRVTTRFKKGRGEILIRDNGPGIPEEIKEFIFDPFFTTKDEGKGTGLGLSMSKTIVERFHGELTLNESYTDGTEFILSLPLESE